MGCCKYSYTVALSNREANCKGELFDSPLCCEPLVTHPDVRTHKKREPQDKKKEKTKAKNGKGGKGKRPKESQKLKDKSTPTNQTEHRSYKGNRGMPC